jgi:hypothetical protein
MVRRHLTPGKHWNMAVHRHARGMRYTRLGRLDISLS